MGVAFAAALVGALVQSATGFGFALVLSPALFAVLDPYEAVATLLVLAWRSICSCSQTGGSARSGGES